MDPKQLDKKEYTKITDDNVKPPQSKKKQKLIII